MAASTRLLVEPPGLSSLTGRTTYYRMDAWRLNEWTTSASWWQSLDAAISFFTELGLELEGRAMVEGEWAGRVTGLGDQRVEIAMMRTPDGHSRLELSRFITPPVVADHRNAPVNALGYLRVMFAVDDIDETLVRLRKHGAELESLEVVQYQDAYRLCYIPDLKDFSSGWPKNSAESPRFHVDRGWTSRGHGRKRGTEVGNLATADLRSCAFSLIGRLVMRVKRLLGQRDGRASAV